MDKLGKFIARRLYRYAVKHPGKPTGCDYENFDRVKRFNKMWPWSWHKETRRKRKADRNG